MKTVMIVDDEQSVVNGLVEHIPWGEIGLSVEMTAGDGEEALEKVRANKPDIVITDVYMPKMDGLALIQHLRRQYPDIQIVIHSGYDEFDNARTAMRYGVQHFLLKPSMVSEIVAVLQEVMQELDVQEKRRLLLEKFDEQQTSYLAYAKDAFIRELLTTRYQATDIPREKLELMQWAEDTLLVAASLTLIRPPYLTKSKEREWQLMKFSSGNILHEVIQETVVAGQLDIHAVDYSDSTFVLVLHATSAAPDDLLQICKELTERVIDNILLYLKLSLSVGIGDVKRGVHELINSYLESQRALEAADYHAVNQVYTYREVHGRDADGDLRYPYHLLKEIYRMVEEQNYSRIVELWRQFEDELLTEGQMPLFITQNICMSLIGVLMIEHDGEQNREQHMQMLASWFAEIHAQASTKELCDWMKRWMSSWYEQTRDMSAGKKSNKLVQEVKNFIRDHYDQEITLAEIADNLFVNRNYLSQLFKRVTGETFVSYLNRFRIEKAKERMREGHYLISEISEMVGYQNPTYFSQVFKSITGKSPSEFYK